MRVLFDVSTYGRGTDESNPGGGLERQVADLAVGLATRGHEVAIVANKVGYLHRDQLESHGVPLWSLGRQGRYDVRVLTDLTGLVKRYDPDVVVAENFNASLWARLAGIRRGTGIVVAEHSSDCAIPAKEYWTNRLLAPFTHAVVACANAQARSLVAAGHRADSIVVVHNGVDVSRFHPDPLGAAAFRSECGIQRKTFLIGLVASHRREKRQDRLVPIVERMREAGMDVAACAVGWGPDSEKNKALFAASPAGDRLRVVGPRSDLSAVYSACDAVVLTSDAVETFPLCFLEAQSCGTPVVGMMVGGVGETFQPGVSGFLIEQGDVAGMATALRSLYDEPDVRARMGMRARAFVQRELTNDRMVDRYEPILREAWESSARYRRAHGSSVADRLHRAVREGR